MSATGDATPAGSATRVVEGRVELIDRANHVTLSGTERVGHAFDAFELDQGTEITVNVEKGSLADVNPGDEVRASPSLHLERLEILPSSE